MAFDVGSVIAHVKADLTDFKRGMDEVKQEANQMGSHLNKIGAGVVEVGKQAAVFTGVVATGFALLSKNAIQSSSDFEQARISFEVMLGSAEKAQKLLSEISIFAKETPFELPQLVDASKRLLAYNIEAEKIIPTMTMLGNLASGVGTDKLPQLILAFGQVKAATKLTGMELRQFSEAGVPLLQALVDQANKAGGSWQTVGGSAKKAKVDIGELNEKLAIAAQRLKEAEGNAKTKTSTLMSLRKTVQDYTDKIKDASSATTGASKVWVTSKVTAAEMIEKISDGEVTFEMVQEALSGMTNEGGKFFNLMAKQSKTFGGTVSNIKDSIGIMMRSVMGLDIAGNIAEGSIFARLKDAAFSLMQFLQDILPTVTAGVSQTMDRLNDAFNILVVALTPLGEWIKANKDTVIAFLQGVAVGLGALLIIGTIAGMIALITNPLFLVVAAVAALYTAWSTNFLGIKDATTAVWLFISDLFVNYLMPLIAQVTAWVTENWQSLSSIAKGLWEQITGIIQMAWAIIITVIKVALALLQGDFSKAWTAIKDGIDVFYGGLTKFFQGVLDSIVGWGGLLVHNLVKPFEEAWNRISEFMNKIRDSLDFTKRHSPSVMDIINKGVNLANRAFENLDFAGMVNANISPASVMGGSQNTSYNNVTVSLDGALVGDMSTATRLAEQIGDGILKKLNRNIRY